MCDSNIKPKFKAGDKVKCIQAWANQYINEGEVYTIKEVINNGYGEFLVLEGIKENHDYTTSRFELIEQTPKNYRELTPDTLIDISIDGNEFKVPLGDLVHAKALIGVASGWYGGLVYKALKEVFDKEEVIYNSHEYEYVDTADAQQVLFKSYFIDKDKEAKKQALKEVIEKQREEVAKLEQQLIALDDYDGCSL